MCAHGTGRIGVDERLAGREEELQPARAIPAWPADAAALGNPQGPGPPSHGPQYLHVQRPHAPPARFQKQEELRAPGGMSQRRVPGKGSVRGEEKRDSNKGGEGKEEKWREGRESREEVKGTSEVRAKKGGGCAAEQVKSQA